MIVAVIDSWHICAIPQPHSHHTCDIGSATPSSPSASKNKLRTATPTATSTATPTATPTATHCIMTDSSNDKPLHLLATATHCTLQHTVHCNWLLQHTVHCNNCTTRCNTLQQYSFIVVGIKRQTTALFGYFSLLTLAPLAYVCVCVCVCACMCSHARASVCARVCVFVCVCTCGYVCMCVHECARNGSHSVLSQADIVLYP